MYGNNENYRPDFSKCTHSPTMEQQQKYTLFDFLILRCVSMNGMSKLRSISARYVEYKHYGRCTL